MRDAVATLPIGTRLSDLLPTSKNGVPSTPSHPRKSTAIARAKIATGAALCIIAIVVATVLADRTRIVVRTEGGSARAVPGRAPVVELRAQAGSR